MRARTCRVVLDTSIVWQVAFGTPLASVVANIVAALSGLCEVYYTDALALDVQRNTKLGAERQRKLMEAAEALARYMRVGVEELGGWLEDTPAALGGWDSVTC